MSSSSELPSYGACTACRSHKVRCILDHGTNAAQCQRCARMGTPCHFTPLHRRKQRVRTDIRVAELEKRMHGLRQELRQKEAAAGKENQGRGIRPDVIPNLTSGDNHAPMHHVLGSGSCKTISGRYRPTLWAGSTSAAGRATTKDDEDVVDRGIIDMATARQLCDTYRGDLFSHLPMVVINSSTSPEELRRTKPALFLSIIAAAASKDRPDLSARLDEEVLHMFAKHSMVNSEKSIEFVQALLISSVWFHFPNESDQVKYYEYIHMAVTMSFAIGIGSRPAVPRRARPQQGPSDRSTPENTIPRTLSGHVQCPCPGLDTSSIESRRTFLASFVLCEFVALSLRRPCMLRVSAYIRDCADVLERSSQCPTDLTLVAWVRLLILGGEISTAFSYDDADEVALLTDVRTQMMLKEFAKRLCSWREDLPVAAGTSFLLLVYHAVRLHSFEVALHVDHSPADIRDPSQMGVVEPLPEADQIPTNVLADAISECAPASHALLDVFFSMDGECLRSTPPFGYSTVSFAAFILAKLFQSSTHADSRIGMCLEKESLRTIEYLDRTIMHMRKYSGAYITHETSMYLAMVSKLREWCIQSISGVQSPEQDPDMKKSFSAATTSEKPAGSLKEHRDSRAGEHTSGRGVSCDNASHASHALRRSSETLKRTGRTISSSQAGESQQGRSYDIIVGSVQPSTTATAGDDDISPAEISYMQHYGSTNIHHHYSSVGFGNMAVLGGGLAGFDHWPATNRNVDENNMHTWSEGPNTG